MKILITGGAGYVGTTLIPQLLEKGHEVTVYDSLLFGGDAILPFFRNGKFNFIKGDVRDKQSLKKVVKNKDVVYHLAAIVGYPACRKNPILAKTTNMDGTKNLSELLSKNQTVIYASTGSNYGSVDEICTEETPLNPLSLYGETKTWSEQYLLNNNTAIAYRFATAFGVSPRLRLDLLVNDFTNKALKEGYLVVYEKHFMRTFIHVYDMGRSFVFALENSEKMKGNVYNIGSSKMNYSKQDICELIKKKTDIYVHYAEVGEDKDKRDYKVSYEKIHKLGYDTSITVEQGVDELLRALEAIEFKMPYSNV